MTDLKKLQREVIDRNVDGIYNTLFGDTLNRSVDKSVQDAMTAVDRVTHALDADQEKVPECGLPDHSAIWPCEHCAELDPEYLRKGPPR